MLAVPQRVYRHMQDHWGAHPYRHCFFRGVLTAALRTSSFQQLAHGHFAGVLVTEFLMSLTTSSNVGMRARNPAHLQRFDVIWACGAVAGTTVGIVTTHLIYHFDDALWWNPWTWGVWPLVQ